MATTDTVTHKPGAPPPCCSLKAEDPGEGGSSTSGIPAPSPIELDPTPSSGVALLLECMDVRCEEKIGGQVPSCRSPPYLPHWGDVNQLSHSEHFAGMYPQTGEIDEDNSGGSDSGGSDSGSSPMLSSSTARHGLSFFNDATMSSSSDDDEDEEWRGREAEMSVEAMVEEAEEAFSQLWEELGVEAARPVKLADEATDMKRAEKSIEKDTKVTMKKQRKQIWMVESLEAIVSKQDRKIVACKRSKNYLRTQNDRLRVALEDEKKRREDAVKLMEFLQSCLEEDLDESWIREAGMVKAFLKKEAELTNANAVLTASNAGLQRENVGLREEITHLRAQLSAPAAVSSVVVSGTPITPSIDSDVLSTTVRQTHTTELAPEEKAPPVVPPPAAILTAAAGTGSSDTSADSAFTRSTSVNTLGSKPAEVALGAAAAAEGNATAGPVAPLGAREDSARFVAGCKTVKEARMPPRATGMGRTGTSRFGFTGVTTSARDVRSPAFTLRATPGNVNPARVPAIPSKIPPPSTRRFAKGSPARVNSIPSKTTRPSTTRSTTAYLDEDFERCPYFDMFSPLVGREMRAAARGAPRCHRDLGTTSGDSGMRCNRYNLRGSVRGKESAPGTSTRVLPSASHAALAENVPVRQSTCRSEAAPAQPARTRRSSTRRPAAERAGISDIRERKKFMRF